MNIHEEKQKIAMFIRSGLFVLSGMLLMVFGFKIVPKAISVSSNSSGRELPIYSVERDDNKISISFDAAWGNEETDEILAILAKYNIKTTFFMTGGWVDAYPDDVKAIAAEGHDLGNHSENHKHMSQLSKKECIDEIMQVHKKVKALTGKEMQLFRPPYGDYNDTLIKATKECGYYCIQWDVDSLDWKDYGTDSIIKTVLNHKNLGKGSIILFHNGAKYTPAALEGIIIGLKKKGYEIVPISQLIHKEKYTMDQTGRQIKK